MLSRDDVAEALWRADYSVPNQEPRTSPFQEGYMRMADAVLSLVARAVEAERERCAGVAEATELYNSISIAAAIRAPQPAPQGEK